MNTPLAIIGTGALTPLGLNALQTTFLLRTGMPGLTPSCLADANNEPVTFGLLPTLEPTMLGAERLLALASAPLLEACQPFIAHAATIRIFCLMLLDEEWAERGGWGTEDPGAELSRALRDQLRRTFPNAQLVTVGKGAGGAAFALPKALAELQAGAFDVLLLGGLHSDYAPPRLRAIELQGRLFSPDNLDAIVPGECAAFVCLARPEVARHMGLPSLAELHALGAGFERATPDNDESAYEALGITTAVRAATQQLVANQQKAGWMLTDATFEMRRIYEWQAMITRTRELWAEPYHIDTPAQRMGHLGSAALPLHMVLVAEGFRRGSAPSSIAIALAGSDGGERSAAVLSAPAP